MEKPDSPLADNSIEKRVASLEKGVRLFAVTILLLSGIPGVVLASAIKPYAAAFSDVGRPSNISPVFIFVLEHPIYCVTLAVLLPLAGVIITARAQNPFRAMLAACVYLMIVLVQFSITWGAFIASAKAFIASSVRI